MKGFQMLCQIKTCSVGDTCMAVYYNSMGEVLTDWLLPNNMMVTTTWTQQQQQWSTTTTMMMMLLLLPPPQLCLLWMVPLSSQNTPFSLFIIVVIKQQQVCATNIITGKETLVSIINTATVVIATAPGFCCTNITKRTKFRQNLQKNIPITI